MTPVGEPRDPIDWANHYAEQRGQQPARKLLDQMSDRELVDLYVRAEAAEADADILRARSNRLRARAERDGAAIARVRTVVDELCHEDHPSHDHICPDDVRRLIRAALDQPKEATP